MPRRLIHLWMVLPPSVPLDDLLAELPTVELPPSNLSRHQAREWHYVWTRVALRRILSFHTGLASRAISIQRLCKYCGDPVHGKPVIYDPNPERSTLGFSMSHVSDLAVVAVTHDGEVGVDVEGLAADSQAICRIAITKEEADATAQLSQSQRHHTLMQFWVRKEAILKAIGVGLAVSPRFLQVAGGRPQPSHAWLPVRGGGYGTWYVRDIPIGPGHVTSVAARHPARIRVTSLDWAKN